MKKWSLIPAVAALIFFSSADSDTTQTAEIGHAAPALSLSDRDNAETLDSYSGQYVILSFWSAKAPASRIANVRLDRMSRSLAGQGIKVISVCMDSDRTLYNQLLTVDSLDPAGQYHYTDSQLPTIVTDYALDAAPQLYLVNGDGTLVARAAEPETLLASI